MATSDLVRVRLNGVEKNMGRALAESSEGVEILDEPTTRPDGQKRAATRKGGRPIKPKVSVGVPAAEKKAAAVAAPDTAKEA